MQVAELKEELESRGLDTGGLKAMLQTRLQDARLVASTDRTLGV